jgi:hypothetical protein
MQAGYFGSSRPSGLLVPAWMKSITMTATAILYTPFGFAIAADGNQLWQDSRTRNEAIRQDERGAVQKILDFSGKHGALAYLARGDIANADRSFDLGSELKKQLALQTSKEFPKLHELLEAVSMNLENYIEAAKTARRLEDYPSTFVDFVGYFNGQPSWMEIQFFRVRHPRTGALWAVMDRDFWPGHCIVSGSVILRELIAQGHPSFSGFCQFDYNRSLADAAGFVRGYIEACCSPVGLEFDPECEGLGGHIHVATLSPEDGFRWAIEPKREPKTG